MTPTSSKLVELTPVATPAEPEQPMETQESSSQGGGGKEVGASPASSEQSGVSQQQQQQQQQLSHDQQSVAAEGVGPGAEGQEAEEMKGRMLSEQDKRVLEHKDKFPQVSARVDGRKGGTEGERVGGREGGKYRKGVPVAYIPLELKDKFPQVSAWVGGRYEGREGQREEGREGSDRDGVPVDLYPARVPLHLGWLRIPYRRT